MVALVQWLTQDELPTVCIISHVDQVGNRTPFPNRITNYSPCCPRIHTSHYNVSAEVIAGVIARDECSRPQVNRKRLPLQPPKQVKAVDQNDRFVESDLGPRKWLADTVGR